MARMRRRRSQTARQCGDSDGGLPLEPIILFMTERQLTDSGLTAQHDRHGDSAWAAPATIPGGPSESLSPSARLGLGIGLGPGVQSESGEWRECVMHRVMTRRAS